MKPFEPTERTTLRRLPKRGNYQREALYKILDEGFVCHVGFVSEGRPVVIPTAYGRAGDRLYIHGAAASRMLKALREGIDVCVTVTLVDGLVLARSAFHHSMNYRSVVIFGKVELIEDDAEKLEALHAFADHVMRGRWEESRQPNQAELRATMVLALPLIEASAKIRTGPPIDDADDMLLPVWAGELPLHIISGAAVPDPQLSAGIVLPQYIRDYTRNHEGPNIDLSVR